MQALIGWLLSIFLVAFAVTPALSVVAVKQFEEKSYYLKDIDLINDAVGWAVGAPHWDQARKLYVGTIIKTEDGGANWVEQEAGVSELLQGVKFADPNHGWAVGSNGTILYTSDGGANWVKQTVATSHDFYGVSCVNATQGWATTSYAIHYDHFGNADNWVAAIWQTGDGGTTWTPQVLPAGASILHKIEFIDPNQGWAVGAKYLGNDQYGYPLHQPVIYQTGNGGATWQEQYSPALKMTFTGVDFVDANHGWVVGFKTSSGEEGGILFRTTDGGATWERLEAEIDVFFGIPRDIRFVDANRGYIVGTAYGSAWGPILNSTLDGGTTWHSFRLNKWDLAALYGVWASGNRMVAVGDYDFICYSTDPWQPPDQFYESPYLTEKIINIHYNFSSVCFADANRGWAVGSRQFDSSFLGRIIFSTQDGGATWQTQYQGQDLGYFTYRLPLAGVACTEAQHAWAAGWKDPSDSKAILHTTDGGAHWVAQGSEVIDDFNAIQFLDSQTGWSLVRDPYEDHILARTTNGGATWQWVGSPPTVSTNLTLNAFKFTDAQHAWAVGFMGVVLHTANGGASWIQQDLGSAAVVSYCRLHAVDFINNQVGWVGGEGLYRTVDGGAQWTRKDTGVRGDIHAIQFLGARRGWLAGDYGALMTTINGGHTWTPVDSGTALGLKGIAFSQRHPGVGWAVGDRGVIIKVHYQTGFPPPPGLNLLLAD